MFLNFLFSLGICIACAALGWLAHDLFDAAMEYFETEACDD